MGRVRRPRVQFPRLIELWRAGRLDIEGMITHRGRLADVNDALHEVEAGRVVRAVLTT